MTVTDDELLAQLRDALVTGDAAAPSPAEMARFHEAAGRWGSGARSGAGARAGATSRVRLAWDAWRALPPRLSPALVGAAAALGVLGLFGGAVAANTLPGPLRSVAYDAGLPVSSPALVAAEEAESTLAEALPSQDRSVIASDAAALRQRLSALDPSDRATADPRAERLLSEADVVLQHGTAASTTRSTASSASTSGASGGSTGGASGGSTGGGAGGATATPSATGLVVPPPPIESPEPSEASDPAQTTEPSGTTEPAQTSEPSDTSEQTGASTSSGTSTTSSGASSDSSSTTSTSGSTDTTSSSTSTSSGASGDATSSTSIASSTSSGTADGSPSTTDN